MEPTWQPPARNLSALLDRAVRAHGHAPFLTFYDDLTGERTELSYATFDNWVSKTANMLVEEFAVGRGSYVVSGLPTHWTTVVVAFACWRAGACLAPVDVDGAIPRPLPEPAPVGFLPEGVDVDLGVPRVVLVGSGVGARLAEDAGAAVGYAEEVLAYADDYDDPEVTVGHDAYLAPAPFGGPARAAVRLTQGNLLAAAEAVRDWGVSADDRLLCALPAQSPEELVLAHVSACLVGASTVFVAHLDAAAAERKSADERATLGMLSAPALDRLAQADQDLSGLRGVLCPTGVAATVAAGASQQLGTRVWHGHGLLEATRASAFTPQDVDDETRRWLGQQPGHDVGVPTARVEFRVEQSGQRGRLLVRGPVVTPAYASAEVNERAFSDGWLRTDDEGYLAQGPDGRTYVFVTGRFTEG